MKFYYLICNREELIVGCKAFEIKSKEANSFCFTPQKMGMVHSVHLLLCQVPGFICPYCSLQPNRTIFLNMGILQQAPRPRLKQDLNFGSCGTGPLVLRDYPADTICKSLLALVS